MQGKLESGGSDKTSYTRIAGGSSTALSRLQTFAAPAKKLPFEWLENQLDQDRDQIALWAPVAVGAGIAIWFSLASFWLWAATIFVCLGLALTIKIMKSAGRIASSMIWFLILMALGVMLIWFRSWSVAAPVLEHPMVVQFYAEIVDVEQQPARDQARLTLSTQEKRDLPPKVRVNLPLGKMTNDIQAGAIIKLRARLMPPAQAALPGAYDFSRRAWFMGLGASGQVLGDVNVVRPMEPIFSLPDIRSQLSGHVQSQMAGGAGAIGATLATGDRGAISEEDAEAMRRSGLAHLLSISGLHVTAVVGATYLFVLKILALFPVLALRYRLPIVAAGFAAAAALGYTMLTGAQVPTIRACVAALLVLVALMLGRSAITLRMVAAGALFVLIFWPESLAGPSFQLSFAAVTAIIALHENPLIKKLVSRREESFWARSGRFIFVLFITGLVVEIALMPIALFHFHKAGLYGALANIVAIPLTTFSDHAAGSPRAGVGQCRTGRTDMVVM